jgi:hypothetical protein
VAWLSFGSACSSGSTNKCPPGDKARVCDMASEAYRLTVPTRHQFYRGGINSPRYFRADGLFGSSRYCSYLTYLAARRKKKRRFGGRSGTSGGRTESK